jgi:hypothetical protein
MAMLEDPDVWIAQLMQCKPLSEAEVKRLCEKVCFARWLLLVWSAVPMSVLLGGRVG